MKEGMPRIGIDGTNYINGAKVTVAPVAEAPKPKAGDTAKHEATHAVVAEATGTAVDYMTIVPDRKKGYKGLTVLREPNSIVAAAPHGVGHKGTSHDMRVATFISGNPEEAAKIGKKIAEKNEDKISAVASELESKKNLSGNEVRTIMDKAERQEKKVNVVIENPDGTKKEIKNQTSERGVVVFDRKWVQPQIPTTDAKFGLAA